jgi:hypothetical protein
MPDHPSARVFSPAANPSAAAPSGVGVSAASSFAANSRAKAPFEVKAPVESPSGAAVTAGVRRASREAGPRRRIRGG